MKIMADVTAGFEERGDEGDTRVGLRLQRFEGRKSHCMHGGEEILFSGVAG